MAAPSRAASPAVAGVLLARRTGAPHGRRRQVLRWLGGLTVLEHVVVRAPAGRAPGGQGQGRSPRFAAFGLPVAADVVEGFAGPLAGVLTGMEWTRARRLNCPWIVTLATDTPLFRPISSPAR